MDDYTIDMSLWGNLESVPVNEDEEKRYYVCGEVRKRINPLTGQFVTEIWFCKKYHTCSSCQARKNKALLERISPLVNNPQVRVIFHNQPISELNEQYDNRLHVPLDNDGYYSIIQSSDNKDGQPLTSELAQEIASHGVAPKGKRISGNLGKTSTPGPVEYDDQLMIEKPEEISRRVFKYVNEDGNIEDKELVNKIEAETIAETSDLNPQDVDQLQDALYVREQKLVEVAKRYNVEILFLYTETRYVLISQLNWSNNGNAQLKQESPG